MQIVARVGAILRRMRAGRARERHKAVHVSRTQMRPRGDQEGGSVHCGQIWQMRAESGQAWRALREVPAWRDEAACMPNVVAGLAQPAETLNQGATPMRKAAKAITPAISGHRSAGSWPDAQAAETADRSGKATARPTMATTTTSPRPKASPASNGAVAGRGGGRRTGANDGRVRLRTT